MIFFFSMFQTVFHFNVSIGIAPDGLFYIKCVEQVEYDANNHNSKCNFNAS